MAQRSSSPAANRMSTNFNKPLNFDENKTFEKPRTVGDQVQRLVSVMTTA
jgi:hypothetical protein